MKYLTATITALALSACSAPAPGSLADGASTALALSQGGVEANPLLASVCPPEPVMMAACAVGLHAAAAEGLVAVGVERETVRRTQNAVGFGAACHNIAVAAGASTGVGLSMLVLCGAITYEVTKP